MTTYAGVDPGVKKSALCTGNGARVIDILFIAPCNLGHVDHALVEFPRIYPGTPSKDLNDLLDLAAVCGAWLERNPVAERVYPRDWKGQIKKPVHHLRMWRDMTTEDRKTVAKACGYSVDDMRAYIEAAAGAIALGTKVTYTRQAHNLLDAYGIYKETVKRWAKK